MPLPEYKNLTEDELSMADHYAEIGDFGALRGFQRLSAEREGNCPERLNPRAFASPLEPRPINR